MKFSLHTKEYEIIPKSPLSQATAYVSMSMFSNNVLVFV